LDSSEADALKEFVREVYSVPPPSFGTTDGAPPRPRTDGALHRPENNRLQSESPREAPKAEPPRQIPKSESPKEPPKSETPSQPPRNATDSGTRTDTGTGTGIGRPTTLPDLQITGTLNYSLLLHTKQEEVASHAEQIFDRIDLNKDGFIDADETAAAVKNPEFKHKDALVVGLLKDSYSDLVTQSDDEFFLENSGVTRADLKVLFKTLKEYDGRVDTAFGVMYHGEKHFAGIDTDKDGFLSKKELEDYKPTNPYSSEKQGLENMRRLYDEVMRTRNDGSKGISAADLKGYFPLVFGDGPWQLNSRIKNTIAGLQLNLYHKTTDNLFSNSADPLNSIQPEAVEQGLIGDCYFLGPLASMAATDTGRRKIMDMIKDNGPGPDGRHTYTVTFPFAKNEPITVNAPTDSELALYAGATKFGSWPAVMEKAYAKYINSDFTRRLTISPYAVDHDSIAGGSAFHAGLKAFSQSGEAVVLELDETQDDTVRDAIVNSLKDGRPVTMSTRNTFASLFGLGRNETDENKLYRGHAYSIVDYDPATSRVKIRNPWGYGGEPVDANHAARDGVADGTFWLPLSALKKDFDKVEYSK